MLTQIIVSLDSDEAGEIFFTVTPIYEVQGRIVSVPPGSGFATEAGAAAEAMRITEQALGNGGIRRGAVLKYLGRRLLLRRGQNLRLALQR